MTASKNNLLKVVESYLPALSGSTVSYNTLSNMLETQGYTSAAGNTYYQGIRFSERLIINFDLGRGYAYLFLNGIRIYGFNGTEKRLIGSRSYSCCCFCEQWAKEQATEIVYDFIKSQMKLTKTKCYDSQIKKYCRQLVEATSHNMKLLK